MNLLPRSLEWDPAGPALVLLDQTRLPSETVFLRLTDADQVDQAIRRLQVRGAPAIGWPPPGDWSWVCTGTGARPGRAGRAF